MRLAAAVLLALLALAPPSPAQEAPRARIIGSVHDSLLSGAPLAGAEVVVSGTLLVATTDARGRFSFSGVPAGQYQVSFFHPRLDSLGIAAPIVSVAVPAAGDVTVRLATPAPATLLAALCPGVRTESTGLVLGRVRDVDSGESVPGATVSARWPEWVLGRRGFERADGGVAVVAQPDGTFRLCGVASDVPVLLRAASRGHESGAVEVALANRPLGTVEIEVSFADTATRAGGDDVALVVDTTSGAARGSGRVAGTVRDQDGRALAGALVGVIGSAASARTDTGGVYTLSGVPAGAQTLEIRSLGFAPVRRRVSLRSGGEATLDVVLDRNAATLAPMQIVGRPDNRIDNSEFERRRRSNAFGHFITREQIERRGAVELSDLLVTVPGVSTVWTSRGRVPVMMRAGDRCLPVYYLDGVRFATDDGMGVDNFILPHNVRGIEVYRGIGGVPPQYAGLDSECGVILIWTRR